MKFFIKKQSNDFAYKRPYGFLFSTLNAKTEGKACQTPFE